VQIRAVVFDAVSAPPSKTAIVSQGRIDAHFLTVFMARKNASTIVDDEFEAGVRELAPAPSRFDDTPLDARLLDAEDEGASPFLRGQKRVPVRRGALPRKTLDRVKSLLWLLLLAGIAGFIGVSLYRYGTQSWRFQLDSSDNIELIGAHNNITRQQVLEVFGSDIERNAFFVPLSERKRQLEQIPWVESASVMRLLPNRLRVSVGERTPVAFVEINSHIALIDPHGVIMEMPAGQQASYSFPVIVGMADNEPLSTRGARMKIYGQLIKELDSGGTQYSKDLSDVDLSDPDDVKVTVADPKGAVLVHLGSSDFLDRFRIYVSHVQEWRTQFLVLRSVDLRFQHQVIVNPDEISAPANASAPAPSAGRGSETVTPSKKHKAHAKPKANSQN
jgi:cell division protein FtsQ